jgi:hypothetical protein
LDRLAGRGSGGPIAFLGGDPLDLDGGPSVSARGPAVAISKGAALDRGR